MLNLLLYATLLVNPDLIQRQTVIVVVGKEGAAEYGPRFEQWVGRWRDAAEQGQAHFVEVGGSAESKNTDREILRNQLEQLHAESTEPLWLVLIGHGTFDGTAAKFNLRGPDISAQELAKWLQPVSRPLAVISCASASGPFINRLSGPDRVIVTATKSGFEHNFARFGEYISAAIADPAADLDKDNQTSLLEAYLAASAKVGEFYEQGGRLATEHALLDDNGDAQGTPADWFRGVRAARSAKEGAEPDGRRAAQWCLVRSPLEQSLSAVVRARRDQLELQIFRLRDRKKELRENEYYARLEQLLVELAELYEQVEQPSENETAGDSS